MINFIKKEINLSKKSGKQEISYNNDYVINGKETMLFIAQFPKTKEFYAYKIYIYIDKKLLLPLRFVVHNKDDKMIESYQFNDLKINVGLSDRDFDADNPDYGY